jgi:hypothetical protein
VKEKANASHRDTETALGAQTIGDDMTKMTKADRDLAIAEIQANNAAIAANRALKDSALATDGRKRSQAYCAFFASAAFAELTLDCDLDVSDIMNRCDKTLDRIRVIIQRVASGKVEPLSDRDQVRYFTNIMRTMIAAHGQKIAVAGADILAASSKTDTARDFVAVAVNKMSESTAERQSKLTIYTLEFLNVIERVKVGNRVTDMSLNTKSVFYKRIKKAFDALEK